MWVYVKDVLDQLLAGSTDYHSLLPDVWKKAIRRPSAITALKSGATKPNASNSTPPAAASPPATDASIALARLQRLAHHGTGGAYRRG